MLANNEKMTTKWNHVLGHRGIPGNEEAGELAVKGATSQTVDQTKRISDDLNKNHNHTAEDRST